MIIKFKKIDKNAVSPRYAKDGDAGMDLTAVSQKWDNTLRVWSYGTGIAIEVPPDICRAPAELRNKIIR